MEHHGSGWSPNWKLASSLCSPALLSSIVSLKGNSSVFPHSLNASPELGPSSAQRPQCLGLSWAAAAQAEFHLLHSCPCLEEGEAWTNTSSEVPESLRAEQSHVSLACEKLLCIRMFGAVSKTTNWVKTGWCERHSVPAWSFQCFFQ